MATIRLRYLEDVPLYTITTAARLVGVSVNTLRLWEKKGLIKPVRMGKNRLYSDCDKKQLRFIKNLLNGKGFNIKSIKFFLSHKKCWEIKNCPSRERDACPVYKESKCGGLLL